MTPPRRILLTGGGTAGHVNPALAIGRAVAGEGSQLLYVGVRGRAEAAVVPREGIPIRFVRASGYPGARPSLALLRFAADLTVGTIQATLILLRFRPDTIVGTGGFASAPVMFAAALLRKLRLASARVFVHEQNAAPGKLNQVVGRLAHKVFLTFPETLSSFPANGLVTGYPLRRRITPVTRAQALSQLDFAIPPGRQVIFAFGGSQGARTVNRAVVDALGHLLPYRDRLFVIHGTGLFRGRGYDAEGDTKSRLTERYTEDERRMIETFYVSRPFFYQIENVYAVADLVVARAGAGSLYELASLGLPALVIPKANLPGDHQVMNARAMARCGGGAVLYEETALVDGEIVEQLDGARLALEVLSLLQDPERLSAMRERAHAFLRHDALSTIERCIKGDALALEAENQAPDVLAPASPCAELPGNATLLARLERAATRLGPAYRVEQVVPEADDRSYFVSRASSLLASSSWEDRNRGVKLLGLLEAREKLPLLLALLADKRPAPWYKRLLGGDYVQVGFIRRNVLTAIGRLGIAGTDVERALLDAFHDPYFEARSEAARTASRLAGRLAAPREIVKGLVPLLHDRWLEVGAAAAEALGRIGFADDALPALLAMKDARYWVVRAAALDGILSLVERGQLGDAEALAEDLRGFVLTSTDFRPEFQIKRLHTRVMDAIERREGNSR